MDVPTLKRPLLFVHGYSGWADQGKPLAHYAAQNPENEVGGTFRAGREDEFRQSVREHGASAVYTVALSRPRAAYTETCPEFTRAVEILNEETGQEVDAVGHSMGGLVIQEHLRQGHEGLHNVFFEGTPSNGVHGNPMTAALTQIARPVLGTAPGALRADEGTFTKGHNGELRELRNAWSESCEKVERAYTIAGTRLPTPTARFPYVGWGDGVVPEDSVKLEGATNVTVRELDPFSFPIVDNHVTMIANPKVLAFIVEESARE